VSGRLQIRPYEDKEGNRRKAAEVVADSVRFLDKPKEQETRGDLTSGGSVFDNDDIPF
jgi:single-strand DNA-binding protein